MPLKRQARYLVTCDTHGCSSNIEVDAPTKNDAHIELWGEGWVIEYGENHPDPDTYRCPTCQQRPKVLKRSAHPAPEFAFLDAPPTPSKEESKQAELREKLEEARDDWSSRSYVPGTEWTATNENRRAETVHTMEDLMEKFDRFGRWTPAQEQFVKKLIKNTFK